VTHEGDRDTYGLTVGPEGNVNGGSDDRATRRWGSKRKAGAGGQGSLAQTCRARRAATRRSALPPVSGARQTSSYGTRRPTTPPRAGGGGRHDRAGAPRREERRGGEEAPSRMRREGVTRRPTSDNASTRRWRRCKRKAPGMGVRLSGELPRGPHRPVQTGQLGIGPGPRGMFEQASLTPGPGARPVPSSGARRPMTSGGHSFL